MKDEDLKIEAEKYPLDKVRYNDAIARIRKCKCHLCEDSVNDMKKRYFYQTGEEYIE